MRKIRISDAIIHPELGGPQIFMGARGEKRFDIEAIVDAILRLSQLLTDFPQIRELDINPLQVFHEGDGCSALDARIILLGDHE